MSEHTKGPWVLTQDNNCKPGFYIKHADNMKNRVPGYFAEIRAYTSNQETIKANARLIAAAPELLDALEGIMNIVSESLGVAGYYPDEDYADWDEFPELQAAEAAIAKAKGEA